MKQRRMVMAAVVGLFVLFWWTASAALQTKFRWDDKDGKCYTTPVKTQTGSATLVPEDGENGVVFIYLTPKGLSPHACCLDVPWPME